MSDKISPAASHGRRKWNNGKLALSLDVRSQGGTPNACRVGRATMRCRKGQHHPAAGRGIFSCRVLWLLAGVHGLRQRYSDRAGSRVNITGSKRNNWAVFALLSLRILGEGVPYAVL